MPETELQLRHAPEPMFASLSASDCDYLAEIQISKIRGTVCPRLSDIASSGVTSVSTVCRLSILGVEDLFAAGKSRTR